MYWEESSMEKGENRMVQTFSRRRRLFAAALLALLVSSHSLAAEQTRQAAVLLAGQPRRGEEISDFESVIWTALKSALEYSGLRVIRGEETTPAGEAADGAEELLIRARSLESDYLLSWEYASRDDILEIELRWFDLPAGGEPTYLVKKARMGLTLDAVLARATEEMIAAARPQIRIPLPLAVASAGAGVPARIAPGEPPEDRPGTARSETQPGAIPPEAQSAAAGTTAAPLGVPEEAPPDREAGISPVGAPLNEPAQQAGLNPVRAPAQQPVQEPAREPAVKPGSPPGTPAEQPVAIPLEGRRRALTLSFVAAPFFVDGLASDYFPAGYGLFPSVNIWYRWSFARGYIGLGVYSGLNIFRAEGPLAFSDTALLPAGLDIRYGVDSRPVGLYVHLSGGPALCSIDPNDTGRLIKLTYFGQAGIGVTLPMGRAFGFILDASYMLFLEDREEPIRGLAPSAGFYVRP